MNNTIDNYELNDSLSPTPHKDSKQVRGFKTNLSINNNNYTDDLVYQQAHIINNIANHSTTSYLKQFTDMSSNFFSSRSRSKQRLTNPPPQSTGVGGGSVRNMITQAKLQMQLKPQTQQVLRASNDFNQTIKYEIKTDRRQIPQKQ